MFHGAVNPQTQLQVVRFLSQTFTHNRRFGSSTTGVVSSRIVTLISNELMFQQVAVILYKHVIYVLKIV